MTNLKQKLTETVDRAAKLKAEANGCKIKMSTTFLEGATNVKFNEGMDFIHFMAVEGYAALVEMDELLRECIAAFEWYKEDGKPSDIALSQKIKEAGYL